jgi:Putative prokaryotic signal transducing protein
MISQHLESDETLVTVASRSSEVEAAILVNVLQDEGIRAVALGGFTAGFRTEAPGWVRVQTFASDAEAARCIIAELKPISPDESSELDFDLNVDLG